MSVTCTDGTSFDNGVEIVVSQMRSGYTYTATAIGVNGFDPVLAVLNTKTGQGLCNDDEPDAANYAADLPTGYAPAASTTAQISFNQNISSTFADVSLVVGGYGNQSGEFVLLIEGMAVTDADGIGDVFKVNLTPGMVASGVPVTTYMITRGQSNVDPLLYLGDKDNNPLADSKGATVYCDDAGDSSTCYTPMDLTKSTVSIASGDLTTWEKDAVLSLDFTGVALDPDRTLNYLTYVMTSYKHQTEGQYLLAFHIGISENAETTPSDGGLTGGSESSGT